MAVAQEDMDVDTEAPEETFDIYRLESSDGSLSTLIHAPEVISISKSSKIGIFNLLMADVSYSMCSAWPLVIEHWNAYIKNKLNGTTKLFVFSDNVTLLRVGTALNKDDRLQGGTNLTEALKYVRKEVNQCKEEFVNVFIITDGAHGAGDPLPETEIKQMKVPDGKTVNVYLLGITNNFPVSYSIDIRSHLHNGSTNTPPLYWAKDCKQIEENMNAIGNDLEMGSVKMTLNHKGYSLPGISSTATIYPGGWMYYPTPSEKMGNLKVIVESGEKSKKEMHVNVNVKETNVSILLDHLYPQWNNVLIQRHRKNQSIPKKIFSLMDSFFTVYLNKLKQDTIENDTVRHRLMKKSLKTCELKYTTLMNKVRTVIEVEGKYQNEIELANNILESTVSGKKYDVKNLKLRGHGMDEYERDVAEFYKIYKESKAAIDALPAPDHDDCCRITMSSTLSDLQDEDFLSMLEEGKYELLKTLTMTGIPAYAPVRDASQINVWTLTISHMLVTPFTILSQRAIEEKAKVEGSANALGALNKDVLMKADDEKSRFNIIIPIVPAAACTALKRVVRSNLYAMMATFCILKNPHIIDYSAHLAALACAWVRSIGDHPPDNRPGYVTDRLANIVATAELYMERKSVTTYLNVILTEPRQALMTESITAYDEHSLKCESMTKPLFFLGLRKEKVTAAQRQNLLSMLLAEYIGRCLSNYKTNEKDATPFTDFFAVELNDAKKKEEWVLNTSQSIIDEFKASHPNLVENFYAPENLDKAIKKFINSRKATMNAKIVDATIISVNMDKVKRLRNVSNCGDVRFYTFNAWAKEMGIPEEEIQAAYEPSQLLIYVYEALCNRNSRDRLSKEPDSYDKCLQEIKKQVEKENEKSLFEELLQKISEFAMTQWKKDYFTIHQPLVKPLSPEQIVAEAQTHGVDVTAETFTQKYRYNSECKLLRNACQIPACPFYLVPNRRFNQHLAVERVAGEFPHGLHVVSKNMCNRNVDQVVEELITGSHSGTKGRKKCPISNPQPVKKLKTEIDDLLQIYKLNAVTN